MRRPYDRFCAAAALLILSSSALAMQSSLPSISPGGVVSAGAFGGFPTISPGSWIEIYGSNLSSTTRQWSGADFSGNTAPTSLDGVKVTVGGQLAFVDYVSPHQVNALVASTVLPGLAQVSVANSAGASSAYTIAVNPVQPGLLAPPQFQVNGQQYVAALFPDGVTFVLPANAIAGVPSRPALPGETIVLYGVGFGPVTPALTAGTIVTASNAISAPLQLSFGAAPATLQFAGLAPNYTGLYQLNVTVPVVPASDVTPLSVMLKGGVNLQNLVIAVGSGTAPPVLFTTITAPAAGTTVRGTITLSATASANLGVASVKFLVDGNGIGNPVTAAPFNQTWNSATLADGDHTITAVVTDTAGNTAQSVLTVAVNNSAAADTTPPSTPTGLVTGHTTPTQISLMWAASIDNIGVTGYRIYRDGSMLATVTGTSYSDTGLAPATAHTYQVQAYDGAGNQSALTVPLNSTTIATSAKVRTVGPGQAYAKPCAALTSAPAGSLIEIDPAGDYTGDTCAFSADHLTIRGLNGRAKIPAGVTLAQSKAIWVVQGTGTTIENIEFSGAAVSAANGGNGAGIRQEGVDLTLRSCYFHGNQDGILAGDNLASNILIEFSEFGFNGSGSGQTHNLYINHVKTFTFQYNYSHDAKAGHLYKSRAATNYILYNRLSDEKGDTSYEINLPNGGLTYIIGNLIEQGTNGQNSNIVSYGEEGPNANNPVHAMFLVNNTFDNEKATGTFVVVDKSMDAAVLMNNIFYGPGSIVNGQAVQTTNLAGTNPMFVSPTSFDYRLMPGSPALGAGTAPGIGLLFPLAPVAEYLHPASGKVWVAGSALDIGAPAH